MEVYNILWRNLKWRFQNPATIIMNITQPIIWLLLFSTMFKPMDSELTNYTSFLLAGLLVMTALTSAGISCGIANYSLKAKGSYYRIYIAPVKRSSIVLGQILDVEVLAFIGIGILLLLSIPLSVKIATGALGIILIFVVLFLCIFFIASISYSLSFLMPDENAFIGLINTLVLPLYFASTALLPLEQLPEFFQFIVKLNPFSYAIDVIRELILNSNFLWRNYIFTIILFGILSIISFSLAVYKLKKETL